LNVSQGGFGREGFPAGAGVPIGARSDFITQETTLSRRAARIFKISHQGDPMTHYAKLAALGFRLMAVLGLFSSLPGLAMMARIAREPGMDGHMQIWPIAGYLVIPIMAVILFLVARPLGIFVAQGLE
jgi:hypothetical protein